MISVSKKETNIAGALLLGLSSISDVNTFVGLAELGVQGVELQILPVVETKHISSKDLLAPS